MRDHAVTMVRYTVAMADRTLGKHYLRAWREAAGLSLRGLSSEILKQTGYEVSHANIGRVETFEQPYSQELIEAAAVVMECEPGDLLSREPVENPMSEKEITAFLRRLGLPEHGIVATYGVIAGFIQVNDGSQTQSPGRDQSAPASPRRESAPSRTKARQFSA
jgi:transcriptional regulator with XRE-family HTH domain